MIASSRLIVLFVLIFAVTATGVSWASQNPKQEKDMKLVTDPQIRDIGIPVKSVNWVSAAPGVNSEGKPRIYAIMGQQADNLFVLQIDPDTGKLRQFVSEVGNSNYPTATFVSRNGCLYIGAAYAGHLMRFDPKKDKLEDLGEINHGKASFPCRIDEDANGLIWIGSYGTADLTSYNPETGEFTNYGRMDDVDMYNYPLVNSDGNVANVIRMTKPKVVVLNPKTREKQVVGPVTEKGKGSVDLRRGADGHLYITSSEGNFRIEGMRAVPVNELPKWESHSSALSDGTTFGFTDSSDQIYRKLKVTKPGGESNVFELDYEASGTEIFYVHAGPDNRIYGSSILPLHLFRYAPESDELVDLGQCSSASGEAYSMANLNGKIYISSYPAAVISEYDPAKPYKYGTEPGSNPRDLGRVDNISYRPRSTLTGPLGRVWTASLPDYGRWGGPLSYYDPQTEKTGAYYRIFGDGSCYTLAHLPELGLIAVGTTISGGSGTQPKVDEAVLFLWDYKAEEKVWEGKMDPAVTTFNSLLTGPDGRIYGSVSGGKEKPGIFVFDPKTRKFTNRFQPPKGNPLDLGLQNGPDGMIYGFTGSCIYRFDPATLAVEELVSGSFGIVGPIIGKDIYYARGHHLMSVRLFQ